MKSIYPIKLFVITLLAIFIMSSIVLAQGQGRGQKPQGGQYKPQGIQERITELANDLGLTEQQKAQLKVIFQEEMDKIKAIRESNLTPEQKRKDVQDVRESARQKMLNVLNPEQKQKLEELPVTKRLEKLTQELGLSSSQQNQMRNAMLTRHRENMRIQSDNKLTQEQKRTQMRAVQDNFINKVKTILTPEQFEKFRNLQRPNVRPNQRPNIPNKMQ